LENDNPALQHWKRWQLAVLGLLFVIVGAIPVIIDQGISPRYSNVGKSALITDLRKKEIIQSLEITKTELEAFLQKPDAVIYYGRGLYPRFYPMNQGEPDSYSAARGLPYPRLVMNIIGAQFQTSGILPVSASPTILPNGADVLAIGCKGKLNDDWLAMVVYSPELRIYKRDPVAKWTCPLQTPMCDDNRTCH
jgi:hypothetical protein